MPNIFLASISPRRRELLGFLGIKFQVLPSAVEEFVDSNLSPEELVIELASQKAQAVHAKLLEGQNHLSKEKNIIIGADTIVVFDGNILNKPTSKNEAIEMLSYLSNKTHKVYTGVAVISFENAHSSETIMKTFADVSKVRFRELSSFEIGAYVETGEPMDKAGSYALQGVGCAFVESIEGCYTNIIGLPMPKLVLLLRSMGVEILGKQTGAKIC